MAASDKQGGWLRGRTLRTSRAVAQEPKSHPTPEQNVPHGGYVEPNHPVTSRSGQAEAS